MVYSRYLDEGKEAVRPKIETGEFYHVYNRGVDKRNIFSDTRDMDRFLRSMRLFNSDKPIGSIYRASFLLSGPTAQLEVNDKLVNVVAYCLNPNHYHLIVEQLIDGGVSEFMKRLGGGYAQYFNEKNNRSGALFQGKYRYKHIDSDSYLRHLSVYVNLNFKVHQLSCRTAKSSYEQYLKDTAGVNDYVVENREIVLEHFETKRAYETYAKNTFVHIQQNKLDYKKIGL